MRSTRTQDARAVVTGAGSGIGRAFAVDLAGRGSRVVCADIDLAAAQETVDLVVAAGGGGVAVRCDVADIQSVRDLADEAQTYFGLPTIVINNAGIGAGGRRVGEGSMRDWRKVIDVNTWGVVHGCEVFVPLLRRAGRGGVINVASAAGFASAPGMAAYSVSKAGVISLSEVLAAELVGTGLAVSVLCPTFVPTNIFDGELMDEASSRAARDLAARTGMSAEEVARVTLRAFDRGRLYVLPQTSAKVYWRMKRWFPGIYPKLAGRAVTVPDASSTSRSASSSPPEKRHAVTDAD